MISEASFFGGVREFSTAAAIEMTAPMPDAPRMYVVKATGPGAVLKLPHTAKSTSDLSKVNYMRQLGAMIYCVVNDAASTFTLPIKDQNNSTIATLAIGSIAFVSLYGWNAPFGNWHIISRAL